MSIKYRIKATGEIKELSQERHGEKTFFVDEYYPNGIPKVYYKVDEIQCFTAYHADILKSGNRIRVFIDECKYLDGEDIIILQEDNNSNGYSNIDHPDFETVNEARDWLSSKDIKPIYKEVCYFD